MRMVLHSAYYDFGVNVDGAEAPQRSPPDNLTQWTITQSKVFKRKSIEKASVSVREYVLFSVLNS